MAAASAAAAKAENDAAMSIEALETEHGKTVKANEKDHAEALAAQSAMLRAAADDLSEAVGATHAEKARGAASAALAAAAAEESEGAVISVIHVAV